MLGINLAIVLLVLLCLCYVDSVPGRREGAVKINDFVFFKEIDRINYRSKLSEFLRGSKTEKADLKVRRPHKWDEKAAKEIADSLGKLIRDNGTKRDEYVAADYHEHHHAILPGKNSKRNMGIHADLKVVDDLYEKYAHLRHEIKELRDSMVKTHMRNALEDSRKRMSKTHVSHKDHHKLVPRSLPQPHRLQRRESEEEGYESVLVECYERGSLSINFNCRLCSVCVYETVLPPNR